MMDFEKKLKLQAYLDGELPQAEVRGVVDWLAQDQEAAALLAELRQMNQVFKGFEAEIRLPESREFYWSKIHRAIEAQDAALARSEVHIPFSARLRRLLLPNKSVAVVLIVGLLTVPWTSQVSRTETSLDDSGALTFHDFAAGTTLVWLTYPAEGEVAQNDDLDSLD